MNHSIPADIDPQSVQPYDQPMTLERSAALSMEDTNKDPIATRCIAILVTDEGAAEAAALKKSLGAEGAVVKIIAPVKRDLGTGKNTLAVDHGLMTTSSVLYDAVVIVGGKGMWMKLPDAKDFMSDAFRHCKAIACVGDAVDLLAQWGLVPNGAEAVPGVVTGRSAKNILADFIKAVAEHRHWAREADPLTGKVG